MALVFRKMHGLGNDFVILDAREIPVTLSPAQIARLCDRRRGIGCDTLVLIEPGRRPGSAAFLKFFNPDGSESGTCGNATRCVGDLLLQETGQTEEAALLLETAAGPLPTSRLPDGRLCVDMGPPGLGWAQIPLASPMDTTALHFDPPLRGSPLPAPAAVSMGNPHCLFFVDHLEGLDPTVLGPEIERHALFPERANVSFIEQRGDEHLILRVWERGAGLTQACGSAACAAVVAGHRLGKTARSACVSLPGGDLTITWREEDDHVLMAGEAAHSFHGTVDRDLFTGL